MVHLRVFGTELAAFSAPCFVLSFGDLSGHPNMVRPTSEMAERGESRLIYVWHEDADIGRRSQPPVFSFFSFFFLFLLINFFLTLFFSFSFYYYCHFLFLTNRRCIAVSR